MGKIEKIAIIFFCALGAVFVPFAFYVLFIGTPVMLYTEAECLRKGYPKYAVSIGLERYCMNLQGSVTVRVDKADGK